MRKGRRDLAACGGSSGGDRPPAARPAPFPPACTAEWHSRVSLQLCVVM